MYPSIGLTPVQINRVPEGRQYGRKQITKSIPSLGEATHFTVFSIFQMGFCAAPGGALFQIQPIGSTILTL